MIKNLPPLSPSASGLGILLKERFWASQNDRLLRYSPQYDDIFLITLSILLLIRQYVRRKGGECGVMSRGCEGELCKSDRLLMNM